MPRGTFKANQAPCSRQGIRDGRNMALNIAGITVPVGHKLL